MDDEPTEGIDDVLSRAEAMIERQAAKIARLRQRTTISITHRLTSAAADRIFVIDAGRLVDEGTHVQLLAAGGLYARLYREQTTGNREGSAEVAAAATADAGS